MTVSSPPGFDTPNEHSAHRRIGWRPVGPGVCQRIGPGEQSRELSHFRVTSCLKGGGFVSQPSQDGDEGVTLVTSPFLLGSGAPTRPDKAR